MYNFDKLLGRNGEVVELRKEQLLAGAMHIIQQHYADKQNKMEVVAAMFGKKLGKRFTINFYNRLYDVAFDKHGLRVFSDEIFEDELSRLLLERLIIGVAVIVND